jgi:hypothetical protein
MTTTKEPVKIPSKLTTADAAEALGLTRQRVHQLIEEGHITVLHHERTSGAGRLWVKGSDIRKLLRTRGKKVTTKS